MFWLKGSNRFEALKTRLKQQQHEEMLRVWKIEMEENIWFDKFRTFLVSGSIT